MSVRKKRITIDCATCEKMVPNELKQLTCTWGKGKVLKILEPQKGKKPLNCRLKRGM